MRKGTERVSEQRPGATLGLARNLGLTLGFLAIFAAHWSTTIGAPLSIVTPATGAWFVGVSVRSGEKTFQG